MRSLLAAFLLFPILTLAQSVSTSWAVTAFLSGTNRQLVTASVPFPITVAPASPTGTASGSASGSGAQTNGTAAASGASGASNATSVAHTSSTSTTPGPTIAASAVNGGGNGGKNGGAPSPGASGANGIYGPNDGYISGAGLVRATAVGFTVIGVAAGAWLVFA